MVYFEVLFRHKSVDTEKKLYKLLQDIYLASRDVTAWARVLCLEMLPLTL
jgi:hypothetical protein